MLALTLWGPSSQLSPFFDDEPLDPAERLRKIHTQIAELEPESGAEALVMSLEGETLRWAACGQPSLFLHYKSQTLALYQSVDFNLDSAPTPQVPPLPSALLGTSKDLPPICQGELKLRADMELLLVSRSWVPAAALAVIADKPQCVQALAEESEDMPFWWGKLQLKT